jgi:hypothetical protein
MEKEVATKEQQHKRKGFGLKKEVEALRIQQEPEKKI